MSMKRWAVTMLATAMAFGAIPNITMGATTPVIDINKDVDVTIHYTYGDGDDEVILSNVEFDFYQVADVNAAGDFTVEKDFDEAGFDFSGSCECIECISNFCAATTTQLQDATENLEGYAEGIAPDVTATTDTTGSTYASDLGVGLYLITIEDKVIGDTTYSGTSILATLPTYDTENNTWSYVVTAEPKSVVYSVYEPEPDGGGSSKKQDVTVEKIWDDAGYENKRPESITVILYCNGSAYDEVELSEDNDWEYTWEDLSKKQTWDVDEVLDTDVYEVEIVTDGDDFTITNTYIEDPEDPEDPENPDIPSRYKKPDPVDVGDPHDPSVHMDSSGIEIIPQTGTNAWMVPVFAGLGLLCILGGLLLTRKRKAGDGRHGRK